MARRKTQLFNLSLLDLLTSALGAIIFLFIITPKGGKPAAKVQQAMVYFDTTQMKIHGELHDSLANKKAGDTLFTVLVAYKDLPKPAEQKRQWIFASKKEEPVVREEPTQEKITEVKKEEPIALPETKPKLNIDKKPELITTPAKPIYRGDAPSVPCKVSVEINWPDSEDNVDLFVCKGNSCVYGARKRDRKIGNWDSGKSRNRLFGNDFRTNQEAVRQFDRIIPGEYKLYAQFKASKAGKKSLTVNGLIYTKGKDLQERGESFSKKLSIGKGRTLIGTLVLKENGIYYFKKS